MGHQSCEACASLNKKTDSNSTDVVYTKHAVGVRITLCGLHSIELFKLGQNRFLLKYPEIVSKGVEASERPSEATEWS